MTRYDGQVVLITGAAAGIGRALAREFAQRGAALGAIDVDAGPLHSLTDELRREFPATRLATAVADVTDRLALRSAMSMLERELGPTDIIIANAGVGEDNPVVGFDAAIFTRQVSVNLIGVANTLEPVLPGMLKRRRGHLVALSSLASYRGLPLMAGYCASKAGVSAFMDSLRVELKESGIACTTICPGFIRTDMTRYLELPAKEIMTLDNAVGRMMRAIDRRQPYLAFPNRKRWLLTLNRVMPTSWGDWLTHRLMGKIMKQKLAILGTARGNAVAEPAVE
jgi:short-subunit dehydrogenase